MADVFGPVSTLPGYSGYAVPVGTMCDDHSDRPATHRVQGETDSMGCEVVDMCELCYNLYRDSIRNADTSGRCDWCKGNAPALRNRRDWEEGSHGPVYRVCDACIKKENEQFARDNPPDEDDYDFHGEDFGEDHFDPPEEIGVDDMIGIKPLNEPIMSLDSRIIGNYLYVVDGQVVRSDYHNISVREFKVRMNAQEVRRCDMSGRGMFKRNDQAIVDQWAVVGKEIWNRLDKQFIKNGDDRTYGAKPKPTVLTLNWIEVAKICGVKKWLPEMNAKLEEACKAQGIIVTRGKAVTFMWEKRV